MAGCKPIERRMCARNDNRFALSAKTKREVPLSTIPRMHCGRFTGHLARYVDSNGRDGRGENRADQDQAFLTSATL